MVAAGGAPVYDANGAIVSGSASLTGSAVSTPFTVADSGFGPQQVLMLFSALLLIAAVAVPPLLSTRLRRPPEPRP